MCFHSVSVTTLWDPEPQTLHSLNAMEIKKQGTH